MNSYTNKKKGILLFKAENIDNDKIKFKYDNKDIFYNIKSQFAYYLAGLIEGDGCIITPKIIKGTKKYNPVIKIVFAEKDLDLGKKILLSLPGGILYKEKGKYYTLRYNKLSNIYLIIHLINGKMRTPKVHALYKLIDWFIYYYNINIEKLALDISGINSNSWLSGFLDCDSCFSAFFKINDSSIATNISCYMRLSQRRFLNTEKNIILKTKQDFTKMNCKSMYSYFPIMESIREFLDVRNIRNIHRIRENNKLELGYEIRTVRKASNKILINYLDSYPLFSSKHLDYLNWKTIYEIKINKSYKKKEMTNKLIELKLSMNNNRTLFNWDHLENLWTI